MRAKVLQILAALIVALGLIASPALGRNSYTLDDCGSGQSSGCGGG